MSLSHTPDNPYIRTFQLLQSKRKLQFLISNYQELNLKTVLKIRLDIFRTVPGLTALFSTNKLLYKYICKRIVSISNHDNNFTPGFDLLIPNINKQAWHPHWFKDLRKFGDVLKNHNAILLVQGSYADGKITPYSDVDLVVIGDLFSPEISKVIIEIEKLILKIDPLQHHGVTVLDPSCLDAYWQMDLPIVTLQRSICFSEEPHKLRFMKIIKESYGARSSVINTVEAIRRFLENKNKDEIGLWTFKYFLSQLMLLPTLMLEAMGEYVYKADSFTLAQRYYGKTAWYCIKSASEARNTWPNDYERSYYSNCRKTARQPVISDKDKVTNYQNLALWKDPLFPESLEILCSETHFLLDANEH